MSGANVSPIGRNKEKWFVPATDYRKLAEPPRPRFSKERGHLLDGAATPPLPRRGVPFGCFATFIESRLILNSLRSGDLKEGNIPAFQIAHYLFFQSGRRFSKNA